MTMTTLEIRRKVRMEQWKNLIMECRSSGLTVTNFCAEHNLSWHAYYYWLKRIREQLAASVPEAAPDAENHFIRLPAVASAPASGSITLRKGAFSVDITGDVSKGMLRNIIQLLNEEAT